MLEEVEEEEKVDRVFYNDLKKNNIKNSLSSFLQGRLMGDNIFYYSFFMQSLKTMQLTRFSFDF